MLIQEIKRPKMLVDNQHAINGKKRSLILAGGGMRLAYQAGVLVALEEENLVFNHVDGTSGGIFNTAMLASVVTPTKMAANWRTLKVKDFVSMRKFWNYFSPTYMKGYTDADNIRDKVFPHLGIDLNTINKNKNINATFNVCNFTDKSIEAIANSEVKLNHLLAGVSLPIVMPALEIDDKWYTDAVWIKDANILEAVRQGATEIYLVWAIGNNKNYLPGALNQYVHMIEMSANGALLEDYSQIKLINEKKSEKIKLFVIKPEFPLPLDPDLFFNKIDMRSLINMGYSDAKDCLKSMPAEGVAMDKNATKMSEPGNRLCFRGVHRGSLLWDGTPTGIIYHSYLRFSVFPDNSRLSLFASIHIDIFDKEIPLFDIAIGLSKKNGQSILEATSKFLIEGEIYHLRATWRLDSPLDILMGLGFKSVSITVTKSTEQKAEILSGDLFQSILDRLRSCFQANVRTEQGRSGGLIKKYKMMSKFVSYEV